MKVVSLHTWFLHELGDLLDAEEQILQALPTMIKAAGNPDLKESFTQHRRQTQEHVKRLKQAFKLLAEKPPKVTCAGMKGVLKEGEEVLKTKLPPSLKDAAIIGAAQRVEHYEIAGYGTARAHAHTMGHTEVAELLQQTLDEERQTNDALTALAEGVVNSDAFDENPVM